MNFNQLSDSPDRRVKENIMKDGALQGPPEWRLYPEIPLADELMGYHLPLPESMIDQGPVSRHKYLESQYLLLRSEATEMLRRAIYEYKKSPGLAEYDTAFVYNHVCLLISHGKLHQLTP